MDKKHLNYIQKVFDDAVAAKKVAGLNLLVFQNEKEIGYWQSGFADIEKKVAFDRNTICRLFSMSKPVTNVAAWILIERGQLELADEVGKFIPEYYNLQICTSPGRNGSPEKCNRQITIQDLLNMTSGYTYGAWWDGAPLGEHLTSDLINELNKDVMGENKITTLEFAKKLAAIPVSFAPGSGYAYGLSADILGAVIEVVSGMKFSEFLKKNIFEPLGMKDTAFYVPKEKQSRLAKAYIYKNGDEMEEFIYPNLGIQPFADHEPAFESGGAGLCSTLDDYLKFANMLVNGGILDGKRILQQKTVEYFAEARLRDDLQQKFNMNMEHLSGYTYCNLMRVAYEKGKCKMITENGEFGWDGWLGPYVSVDLKNKLVVVMLMQRTDAGTWEVTRKVKNIIYTSL
ncbi:MAG: beta-lactamase family protein [Treponema sp.]|nr:beta-lactamase family protein [Treponema sp.]